MEQPANQIFVRLPGVLAQRGVGKTCLYDEIAKGTFVRPVHLNSRAVAWLVREVADVMLARLSGANEKQIRELVSKIHAERKATLARLVKRSSRGEQRPAL